MSFGKGGHRCLQRPNTDFGSVPSSQGKEPPKSPIEANTYLERRLPYFKLYEELSTVHGDFGDLKSVNILTGAKGEVDESTAEAKNKLCGSQVVFLNPNGPRTPFVPARQLQLEVEKLSVASFGSNKQSTGQLPWRKLGRSGNAGAAQSRHLIWSLSRRHADLAT